MIRCTAYHVFAPPESQSVSVSAYLTNGGGSQGGSRHTHRRKSVQVETSTNGRGSRVNRAGGSTFNRYVHPFTNSTNSLCQPVQPDGYVVFRLCLKVHMRVLTSDNCETQS